MGRTPPTQDYTAQHLTTLPAVNEHTSLDMGPLNSKVTEAVPLLAAALDDHVKIQTLLLPITSFGFLAAAGSRKLVSENKWH